MNTDTPQKAVIIGAGPAGLTAAYEFLKRTNIQPTILEASDVVGGLSQTVEHNGNRMDIGPHRFFSKRKDVMEWWSTIMPTQGSNSLDDILMGSNSKDLNPNGPDPEKEDRVILLRHRVSRIFFLRKFFDYPITLKIETLRSLGLIHTIKSGWGFIMSQLNKLPETSLENFYINRFGKHLYSLFFEGYTEKVWGIHPSKLGADWGSQRVKGLSIWIVVKDMIAQKNGTKKDNNAETSLIENFVYPKYGAGHLWTTVASEVLSRGGSILNNAEVVKIHVEENRVRSVDYKRPDGSIGSEMCDYLLSSMPIKELVAAISGINIPKGIREIASNLPYRDLITVGVSVRKMKIKNSTKYRTYKDRVPDTWIYIQERDVKIGRMQIVNNCSPYMINDYENTMYIGLEYFCNEGDTLWSMDESAFLQMAVNEIVKIGIVEKEDIIDVCQVKVKKAYPSYYGSYYELDKVKEFLNGIDNLYCIGRNGQHRYNNMDHSMVTAMECVSNIKDGIISKNNIWAVNTEKDYHEEN